MAKRVRRKAPPTPDISVCEYPVFLHFSREVMAEREMMLRLAHRAVDLVVDGGHHYLLGLEIVSSMSCIARDDVIKKATDLVHEVLADDS